ncbi:MAG: hypothetical protein OEL84_07915 [Nitrosopumilus sp.]|nr:hypothetical protein [Nitrosopumilus sp.]
MTGMINSSTGKKENTLGLINDNTGMLEENTGLINEDAGMITNNDSVEDVEKRRRKRSRERGKDLKPRDFPLHTLKTLPQFRNKPHEEIRRYIKETKGVDIGSNYNAGKAMLWIFLIFVIAVVGIGLVKWWHNRQEREFNGNV